LFCILPRRTSTIDSETKVYDKKHCLTGAQQNKRQKGAGRGAKKRSILFPGKPSSLHLMQLGKNKMLCLVLWTRIQNPQPLIYPLFSKSLTNMKINTKSSLCAEIVHEL
jgi:hypothetical protein